MAEHTYDYDPDGNRTTDVSQNADSHAAYIDRTATSTYDPRDRLASLTKTDAGSTVDAESYVHDANNNVVSQTVNGTTTAFTYDRNRLVEGVTDGVTSAYNYDPFGRLNTITSGGQVVERHTYDGFDRVREVRRLNGFADYTYDPLDRTKTLDASYEAYTGFRGSRIQTLYLGEHGEYPLRLVILVWRGKLVSHTPTVWLAGRPTDRGVVSPPGGAGLLWCKRPPRRWLRRLSAGNGPQAEAER